MKSKTVVLPLLIALQSISSAAMVAHWKMDEAAGTVADSSGSGLIGTPSAAGLTYGQASVPAGSYGAITVTSGQAAGLGNAIEFTRAAGGSFSIGTPEIIEQLAEPGPVGSLTVMAWVNASVASSSNHRIFSTGTPGGWGVGLSNVDQVIVTTFGVADMRSTTMPSANNVWQHVAYTWNNGNAEVFVNGNSVFTATSAFNDEGAAHYTIGGNAGGTDHFNGRIDDLKIYSTVLSRDEIIAAAVPEPSLSLLAGFGALGLLRRRR